MGHIIIIFGTLIALNFGFGLWVSDQVEAENTEAGVVEIEQVPADQAYPIPKQSAE